MILKKVWVSGQQLNISKLAKSDNETSDSGGRSKIKLKKPAKSDKFTEKTSQKKDKKRKRDTKNVGKRKAPK